MSKKPSAPAGAMSVDQAVDRLNTRPSTASTLAAVGNDPDTDDQAMSVDTDDADCADDAACAPGDGDGLDDTDPTQPQTPPRWWDAQDQAWFADQDPPTQAKILKQERKREGVLQKAKAATQQAAAMAQAQTADVATLAQGLAQFLPRALNSFKNRWQGADWVQLSQRVHPAQYQRLRAAYEAEQGHVQRLTAAQRQAGAAARQAGVKRERAALVQHAPALADRQHGPRRQSELVGYLRSRGASDARLSGLSALEAGLAHKAMLYDRARQGLSQANLQSPNPNLTKAPITPGVRAAIRPAAGGAPSPQRGAANARSRFAQSRSVDDAVSLLNMTG